MQSFFAFVENELLEFCKDRCSNVINVASPANLAIAWSLYFVRGIALGRPS